MAASRNLARYTDAYWWSNDGLRLHYRDYAGPADRPAILCIPGLTRNARDFEGVAERLAGEWRVIAVDLRGRGESAYARDPMTYVPLTYLQDIGRLVDELALDSVIAFGTSLGGILTMLLAAAGRPKLAGALLNDVGPELDPRGLARIRGYVGKSSQYPTWMHAARTIAEHNADVYPEYGIEQWLVMAKRLYKLTSGGRIVPDYDMKIAEPFRLPGNEAGPDMWGAFRQLKQVPTLLVRGEASDILAAGVAERMLAELPQGELVTVPATGHAPTLDEPEAVAGIDRLLATIQSPSRLREGLGVGQASGGVPGADLVPPPAPPASGRGEEAPDLLL
ncbi:alpha/beta fold hydrolase [Sphingomonas qomolangmaensis]|uniref:Alpha/beta hydrolase n=1 Tax=Sphingomonas qomolangmaensis TaxID=2918765 RepID=A0ABY5LBE5_9SPHN|nr:alpha/beta hydrolase [Sphingomonas qomolangmaensis]UUL83119.1 alpha/beta hydrolase [Sphingomonas qomolangmaensis]